MHYAIASLDSVRCAFGLADTESTPTNLASRCRAFQGSARVKVARSKTASSDSTPRAPSGRKKKLRACPKEVLKTCYPLATSDSPLAAHMPGRPPRRPIDHAGHGQSVGLL